MQQKAIDVSEAEILTFAVRRMDIFDAKQPNLLERLDVKNIRYYRIQPEQKC